MTQEDLKPEGSTRNQTSSERSGGISYKRKGLKPQLGAGTSTGNCDFAIQGGALWTRINEDTTSKKKR